MLGADWDKTYAASNTIYVARQNNVLFSVLAQFFGPDAINSRMSDATSQAVYFYNRHPISCEIILQTTRKPWPSRRLAS